MTALEKHKQEQARLAAERYSAGSSAVNSPTASAASTTVDKKNNSATGRVIFGTKNMFKGKQTPLEKIDDFSGSITISGEIFYHSVRDIYGGRILHKFDISDSEGKTCISCKLLLDEKTPSDIKKSITESLSIGANVALAGEAQYDKYSRETVVNINAIQLLAPNEIRTDDAAEKRVELHLHTQMSSMDGLASIESLVERAIHWGHPAMAITDHGVVQSFPNAHNYLQKLRKKIPSDAAKNFKLIYGVEAYLTDVPEEETALGSERQKSHHVTILAQNQTGLANLYRLITYSHVENFYKRPRIDKITLAKHREGLLIGSACEQGEIYKAILNKDANLHEIAELYDYFEIMPLGNNQFMIDRGLVKRGDLQEINKKIIALGKELGKPVVATGDVHFLDEKNAKFRAILQAGQGYADADNQAPLYYRTTEEMLAEFDYLDEATAHEVVIENTQKIANMIDVLQPIPDGTFPPEMEGSEEEVQKMCDDKAAAIYGSPLPEIVAARMEKELSKINKYGFSVMYLIAQKLVAKSLSDGYIVGSRGSVGSSFVAFLCGITDVNALPPHYVCLQCHHSEFITDGSQGCGADMPDKACPQCKTPLYKDGHDIPFETFLGFEGDKEPDIDLNFSGEYQPTAHKYVEELFGTGYVFRAGTIGTLASKTAYGFVKKYMEARGESEANSATINKLVQGCIGVKRTTGQHPGGVMVLPKGHDIHEFCPVQHPADDKTKNVLTTHFDYHSISGRLLKLDILGHDDPTVIKMLEDLTGVDASTIPLDDPATLSLFTSTKALGVEPKQIGSAVGTYGVPEFGTGFVQGMLVDTKPKTLSELVRISGLSHGTDVWLNNAKDLIKAGTATLKEVICTRDDIMTYLMYQGLPPKVSFDIMERVRKGKGVSKEDEAIMKKFKVPQWYITSCNRIQYMFPKAHAVAYVTMAFKIAWFKVHHPRAFYQAYFTVRADEFNMQLMADLPTVTKTIKRMKSQENTLNPKDKNVLTISLVVQEMFARGMEFLPVNLYASEVKKFTEENGKIRPPLIAVPGLGESVAITIKQAREEAEFTSVEDLKSRTKANKAVLELLEQQGVLEGIPASEQLSFF